MVVGVRQLFGGAIDTEMPLDWRDGSDYRQIPDSQEVLLDPDTDRSLIVEALEYVTRGLASRDGTSALKLHWEAITDDNEAEQATLLETDVPAASDGKDVKYTHIIPPPMTAIGSMRVAKSSKNPEDVDTVGVFFAIWRLPGVGNGGAGTDLALTLNCPLPTDDLEAEKLGAESKRIFRQAVGTLRIHDWGLFGQS